MTRFILTMVFAIALTGICFDGFTRASDSLGNLKIRTESALELI